MAQSSSPAFIALVFQKEAQVHALWAVYTAVQFTLGGFGISQYHDGVKMPALLGFAVLAGTWAFNIGHLSMILRCIKQIRILKDQVSQGTLVDPEDRPSVSAIVNVSPFSTGYNRLVQGEYANSLAIHLFIDCCASIALMSRVIV